MISLPTTAILATALFLLAGYLTETVEHALGCGGDGLKRMGRGR